MIAAVIRTAYRREARLGQWPVHAAWGYDAALESYWARLRPRPGRTAEVEIGPDHLIGTLVGLARALARTIDADETEVFLALTCPGPERSPEAHQGNLA